MHLSFDQWSKLDDYQYDWFWKAPTVGTQSSGFAAGHFAQAFYVGEQERKLQANTLLAWR